MEKHKLWTKNFVVISAANFFLFLTYYYLLVTLPSAAIDKFNASGSVAGLFTTAYLAAAIMVRPFMGPWIEKLGKQKVLFLSMLLFFIPSFMYTFFDSITALLVLRFIHGISFGMATTVTGAIVADIVPDSRKGEGMGYFIMSANLSMVAGPFLGLTIVGKWGIQVMFWFSAIFSLGALLLVCMTRLPKDQKGEALAKGQSSAMFEKAAVPIAFTGAFFAMAYSAILSFIAVFAKEQGLHTQSSYFFVVYAVLLLATRPFTGRWFDKYGPNVIVFPAIVLFALGMLVLSMTKGALIFFTAAALIGIGWGTLFPSFQTIAVQSASPKRRSVATATYLSIFDIGIGAGSFIIGAIAGNISLETLYFYCSIYITFGIGLYYWAQKQRTVKAIRSIIKHKGLSD